MVVSPIFCEFGIRSLHTRGSGITRRVQSVMIFGIADPRKNFDRLIRRPGRPVRKTSHRSETGKHSVIPATPMAMNQAVTRTAMVIKAALK